MQLLIRKIKNNDYNAVAQLIKNELGYSDLNLEKFFIRMSLMDADPSYITFVAQEADEIVGFIGLTKGVAYELDGQYLRIIALAVSEPYQNQGIGTALLKHAEQYATEIGITGFTLNSGFKRTKAHDFYEKNGFVKRSYGFSKSIH